MVRILILILVVSQINAGPNPDSLARYLRINRLGMGHGSYGGNDPPACAHFPINRYLKLAGDLQRMPERERITWLRMAARSPLLNEPAVLVSRMLIEAAPDKRLKKHRNIGFHYAGKSDASFGDSPIEFHKGIPFCVAGFHAGGPPADAIEYVEYLLEKGEWRKTEFQAQKTTDLVAIANDYLDSMERDGLKLTKQFRKDIIGQASVPVLTEKQLRAGALTKR